MPANLGIPPWLQPPDVAGSFLGGARIGLGQAQIGQEANRLQLQADQMAQQQMEDQQRLAIQHQYQQQEIALRRQDLAEKQKMNQIATQEAARQSQAMMGYTRDLQGIEGRADLTPDQKEQAKIGLMMKYGPQMSEGRMSGLGTMMSALYRQRVPPPTWVPANPQTGEPAHWLTHSGDVHLPQQLKPAADPGKFIDTQEHSRLMTEISKLEEEIGTGAYKGNALKDATKRLEQKRAALSSLESKYGRGSPATTPAKDGVKSFVRGPGGFVLQSPTATATAPAAAPAQAPAPAPAEAPALAPAPGAGGMTIPQALRTFGSYGAGQIERGALKAGGAIVRNKALRDLNESLAAMADLPFDTSLRKKIRALEEELAGQKFKDAPAMAAPVDEPPAKYISSLPTGLSGPIYPQSDELGAGPETNPPESGPYNPAAMPVPGVSASEIPNSPMAKELIMQGPDEILRKYRRGLLTHDEAQGIIDELFPTSRIRIPPDAAYKGYR